MVRVIHFYIRPENPVFISKLHLEKVNIYKSEELLTHKHVCRLEFYVLLRVLDRGACFSTHLSWSCIRASLSLRVSSLHLQLKQGLFVLRMRAGVYAVRTLILSDSTGLSKGQTASVQTAERKSGKQHSQCLGLCGESIYECVSM